MKPARTLLLIALLAASPAAADPTEALLRAEEALDAASGSLEQRRALTRATRAYEAALADLGARMVDVSQASRAAQRDIDEARSQLSALVSALARLGQRMEPLLLAGSGAPPEDAVRAGLVFDSLAAGVTEQSAILRADKAALDALYDQQEALRAEMTGALSRLEEMRALLIAQADPGDETPDISRDAGNLAALAVALASAELGDAAEIDGLSPPLPSPVQGRLARGFNDRDAAGLSRPGISVATAPGALVTSPFDASVRFVGQLDGYGSVVILEPAPDVLLVLAGLDGALVRQEGLVDKGQGVGFMPGTPTDHENFLLSGTDDPSQRGAKTLYMELRHDQRPVDPHGWFDAYR